MTEISSLEIQRQADLQGEQPAIIASAPDVVCGGSLTLWRFSGAEVIETNGDPVWDTEDGFEELKEIVLNRPSS